MSEEAGAPIEAPQQGGTLTVASSVVPPRIPGQAGSVVLGVANGPLQVSLGELTPDEADQVADLLAARLRESATSARRMALTSAASAGLIAPGAPG